MKKRSNTIINYIYIAIVLGIIVGVILGIWDITHTRYFHSVLFDEYSAYLIPLQEHIRGFDVILLKRRLAQIVFLYLMSKVINEIAVGIGASCVFCIFFGIVSCEMMIAYGIRGMVYSILCFFPQFLLYYFAIISYILKNGKKWQYDNLVNKTQYLVNFFVIILFFILGLIWEIKFQKNILIIFYQYLV